MRATKYDKTLCLNSFNIFFMPSFAYPMIAKQFAEQQWNKIISPTICTTLNTADMVKTLAHAILYSLETYQGLGVKNLFFLQEIIHIIAFTNEPVCSSQTGELYCANTKAFLVEMGIPISLTSTSYNEKKLHTIFLWGGTSCCGNSLLIFCACWNCQRTT